MDMTKSESSLHLRDVLSEKYAEILSEYRNLAEKIDKMEKRQTVLEGLAKDCHVAAKLFDINLDAEVLATDSLQQSFPGIPPAQPTEIGSKSVSIREFALKEAEAAYPRPVRASVIRRQLAELGHITHEKTVGMTLYRLLKQKLIRRKGIEWFFIPEAERPDGNSNPSPARIAYLDSRDEAAASGQKDKTAASHETSNDAKLRGEVVHDNIDE